jgi:hypothetical protein
MSRKLIAWAEVQCFHDAGNDRDACARRFGFQPAAWYRAIYRGKLRAPVSPTRYDWGAVQRYYDEGHSYRECRVRFGFSAASWTNAVNRGVLVARARRWPLQRLLAEAKSRRAVKRRLLEVGILKNVCEECGLSEWRGLPISIQLDHRNGIRDDHRLENLRMLCPNCHSQTETFAARNRTKKKYY